MAKVWKNDLNNPQRGKTKVTQSERSLLLGITDFICPTSAFVLKTRGKKHREIYLYRLTWEEYKSILVKFYGIFLLQTGNCSKRHFKSLGSWFQWKKTGSQTGVNISVNLQAKGRDDCHTVMLVIRSLSFSSEVCEDG